LVVGFFILLILFILSKLLYLSFAGLRGVVPPETTPFAALRDVPPDCLLL
jgi:hypothetical protein